MIDKNVSRGIFEEYIELVLKWNNKINLMSRNVNVDNILERHIYDCCSLIKFIDCNDKVLDIGSGAGFPGIVLSLIGVKDITLVESDSRKAAFLLQASKISKNKITIINDRVENLSLTCDIMTSRAFASVNNILNLCKDIRVSKKCLFLKGNKTIIELDEANKNWYFNYKIHNKDNGYIVELDYDTIDCKPKRRGG